MDQPPHIRARQINMLMRTSVGTAIIIPGIRNGDNTFLNDRRWLGDYKVQQFTYKRNRAPMLYARYNTHTKEWFFNRAYRCGEEI